jgi:hypothetical protein
MADSSRGSRLLNTRSNLASFKAAPKRKQARNEAGLCDICAKLSRLPAVPVAMVMVMVAMVPTVMAVMPPMHFRCRHPGVFLNRRGRAGIAERQRIGALGWSCQCQQRANGGESQNFRELHEMLSLGRVSTSAPNRSPQRCTKSDVGDLNGS